MEALEELVLAGLEPNQAIAFQIFSPYRSGRVAGLMRNPTPFVHYTSAEVAASILTNEEVWMRNALTMNDFSEIEYGTTLLSNMWKSPIGERFKTLIDGIFPAFSQTTAQRFDEWLPKFKRDTYLTCISEHRMVENDLGRLSMWRAYGGATGVALVLNPAAFSTTTDALKAYSMPVSYFDQDRFFEEWQQIVDNVERNVDFIRSIGQDEIEAYLFEAFRSAVVGTKHPGFEEEAEWRVVHSPTFEPSDVLRRSVRVVRGTPQTVFMIPLRNIPEAGLNNIALKELLVRVIVGPCDHAYSIAEALAHIMVDRGIEDPWSRIAISEIPLRNTA